MYVKVCGLDMIWDPGFESLPNSSQVLTPIWATPLQSNVTKNSRHGGWTGDVNHQTGVIAVQRQAVSSGGGSVKRRANRTNRLHLHYKTASPFCRKSMYIWRKTCYLFCKRPFIYRILTPGSNPLQKRRKTGSEARRVHYGDCRLARKASKQPQQTWTRQVEIILQFTQTICVEKFLTV